MLAKGGRLVLFHKRVGLFGLSWYPCGCGGGRSDVPDNACVDGGDRARPGGARRRERRVRSAGGLCRRRSARFLRPPGVSQCILERVPVGRGRAGRGDERGRGPIGRAGGRLLWRRPQVGRSGPSISPSGRFVVRLDGGIERWSDSIGQLWSRIGRWNSSIGQRESKIVRLSDSIGRWNYSIVRLCCSVVARSPRIGGCPTGVNPLSSPQARFAVREPGKDRRGVGLIGLRSGPHAPVHPRLARTERQDRKIPGTGPPTRQGRARVAGRLP